MIMSILLLFGEIILAFALSLVVVAGFCIWMWLVVNMVGFIFDF